MNVIRRTYKARAAITLAIIAAAMGAIGGSVVAQTDNPQKPSVDVAGPASAAPAALFSASAGPISAVTVVTSNTPTILTGADAEIWDDVPGMTRTVTIPANRRALIIARYTAESACYLTDGPSPNAGAAWCQTRIMIGRGTELHPRATGQPDSFAFDSPDRGTESDASWEGHAMDRSILVSGGAAGATYTVRVQRALTNKNLSFWLDEHHFTVETALIP